MSGSVVLQARGLGLVRHGQTVLAGVDLDLIAGGEVLLLGRNGAGKSTLLRLLGGLLTPTSGAVVGLPVSRSKRACHVAFLPQETPAALALEVRAIVAQGRLPHAGWWGRWTDSDCRAVNEGLCMAGVQHLAARRWDRLSGGEKRRVLLARMYAQQAPVLLLDEPLAGLDPRQQCEFLDLLDALRASGRAVVWSLHDLAVASTRSAQILLLEQGVPVLQGDAEGLFARGEPARALGVAWDLTGRLRLLRID